MGKELKNFIPRNGRMLVRQPEAQKITGGGLIIPEKFATRPNRGVIVALDPDIKAYKVDDKILFHAAAGFPLNINGEELRMINILEVFMSYEGDD